MGYIWIYLMIMWISLSSMGWSKKIDVKDGLKRLESPNALQLSEGRRIFNLCLKKEASRSIHQPERFVHSFRSEYGNSVEVYIRESSNWPDFCYRLLNVIKFIDGKRKNPSDPSQEFAISTTMELIIAIGCAFPNQRLQEKEQFIFIVNRLFLFTKHNFNIPLSNPVRLRMLRTLEYHATAARDKGKRYYPYACLVLNSIIQSPYCDKIQKARCAYWQAWMYLNSGNPTEAIQASKKIPKIPGMKSAEANIYKWSQKKLTKK